ncbi:MAG: hypothetical protein IIC89_06230, partial [Chloroflexi bacterium]|nr:hypothetical protein [Chloroflexota bacterium]
NGFRDRPVGASGLAIRRKVQAATLEAEEREQRPSPDQQEARLIICDACGEGPFKNGLAKARHTRKEHPKAD